MSGLATIKDFIVEYQNVLRFALLAHSMSTCSGKRDVVMNKNGPKWDLSRTADRGYPHLIINKNEPLLGHRFETVRLSSSVFEDEKGGFYFKVHDSNRRDFAFNDNVVFFRKDALFVFNKVEWNKTTQIKNGSYWDCTGTCTYFKIIDKDTVELCGETHKVCGQDVVITHSHRIANNGKPFKKTIVTDKTHNEELSFSSISKFISWLAHQDKYNSRNAIRVAINRGRALVNIKNQIIEVLRTSKKIKNNLALFTMEVYSGKKDVTRTTEGECPEKLGRFIRPCPRKRSVQLDKGTIPSEKKQRTIARGSGLSDRSRSVDRNTTGGSEKNIRMVEKELQTEKRIFHTILREPPTNAHSGTDRCDKSVLRTRTISEVSNRRTRTIIRES
jgi:hypothetical protein